MGKIEIMEIIEDVAKRHGKLRTVGKNLAESSTGSHTDSIISFSADGRTGKAKTMYASAPIIRDVIVSNFTIIERFMHGSGIYYAACEFAVLFGYHLAYDKNLRDIWDEFVVLMRHYTNKGIPVPIERLQGLIQEIDENVIPAVRRSIIQSMAREELDTFGPYGLSRRKHEKVIEVMKTNLIRGISYTVAGVEDYELQISL